MASVNLHSRFLRPKKEGEVTFSCPRNQGAVLCLPIEAKREDTVANTRFGKWMIRHIDQWFAWARQLELGVDRMEDIVLVTGTHRTRSCTNVAFPGGQDDAQASFGAKVDHSGDSVAINWQFSRVRNRGAVLNCGPSGEVWLSVGLFFFWSMTKYLPHDIVHDRTYQRISASLSEDFALLVNS
jgi:hypothetical protein